MGVESRIEKVERDFIALKKDVKRDVDALKKDLEHLIPLAEKAREYIPDDPAGSLNKARVAGEALSRRLCEQIGAASEYLRKHTKSNKAKSYDDFLSALSNTRAIPQLIITHLKTIQGFGNYGSHYQGHNEPPATLTEAQICLDALSVVTAWYFREYHDEVIKDASNSTQPDVRPPPIAPAPETNLAGDPSIALDTQSDSPTSQPAFPSQKPALDYSVRFKRMLIALGLAFLVIIPDALTESDLMPVIGWPIAIFMLVAAYQFMAILVLFCRRHWRSGGVARIGAEAQVHEEPLVPSTRPPYSTTPVAVRFKRMLKAFGLALLMPILAMINEELLSDILIWPFAVFLSIAMYQFAAMLILILKSRWR